jgi:phage protein D
MPQPIETSDSYAPLLVSVTLFAGERGSVRLPVDQYFQSLSVEYKGGSSWVGKLILFDEDDDYLEDLIFAAGAERGVELQWGWDTGQGLTTAPIITGRIMQSTPTFSPEGVSLELELLSRVAYEQVIDKKVRSFPAQKLASEIVQEIVADREWKSVIEPTADRFEEPFSYKDESDQRFISDKMLKRATDANGAGYVFFFDNHDVLHFHGYDYNEGRPQKHAVKTYTYARGSYDVPDGAVAEPQNSEVISFSPSDGHVFSVVLGGGNTEFTAVDSEGGRKVRDSANVKQGAAQASPRLTADETNVPDLGTGTHSRISFIARSDTELTRLAQSRYDRLRNAAFSATLEARGTHEIGVMDFVSVKYVKRDGEEHYMSGVYRAYELTHQIDSSGWKLSMNLTRKGARPVAGSQVVAAAERKVTPSLKQLATKESIALAIAN